MDATKSFRFGVAFGLTALLFVPGADGPAHAAESAPANSATAPGEGLSHSAAAIHEEIRFEGSCARVYAALTDAKRFDALTRLSDAVTLLSAPNAKPTAISAELGGPFTLFGGYITGRQLEMVRDKRLVQAWRAASWAAGDFSVVKFVLEPQGQACKVIFDHEGFPTSHGASLLYGWRVHYWEPLAKLLAQS